MTVRVLAGIVMGRTYVISRTPWRKKVVVSITRSPSSSNSYTMTTKSTWPIATLTPTPIAQNF